jgi:hypothetical protein
MAVNRATAIFEMGTVCIWQRGAGVLAVSGLLLIGLVASETPLGAQTIQNPTTVEFDPSPDHGETVEGTPLVDRYEMDFFVGGNDQPVLTLNLGKPAPADGRIRVNFAALLAQPLTPGTIYTALVAAVGPGGRAASDVAPDTFSFTVPCNFSVSPTNPTSLAAGGGSASVTVTTSAGCVWASSESASWLTITSGSNGNGTGTVSYTATANTTTSSRSATMTVAGQSVTVTQDAAPCTFAVSPMSPPSLGAGGGSASVSVTTMAGCAWTATEAVSWLTITGGASGTGNGTVNYSATANTTTSSRSATLTVAGRSVTVTQDAAPCTFTVSPAKLSVAAGGGIATISVTTAGGCAWTASESASWLSITSGSNGSGSGSVTIAVTGNTTAAPRTTTVTVAGQSVVVTQPAAIPGAPTNVRIVGSGGGQ